jgi:yecA family protein
MMTDSQLPNYSAFSETLKSASLAVTPAELHGLLTGLLSGGLNVSDHSWQPLLFDYTNEGMGWPVAALTLAEKTLSHTAQEMGQEHFFLSLLLPDDAGDEGVFVQADALSEWVNHFISGLGLSRLDVKSLPDGAKEALTDLEEIAKLAIDEEDDLAEQALLLEQVIEHVKVCVLTIHAECGYRPASVQTTPTLH